MARGDLNFNISRDEIWGMPTTVDPLANSVLAGWQSDWTNFVGLSK